MREYNIPPKDEFAKLNENDMVKIIAEDYNISSKKKMKTYFNEFPIRKNKRRICGRYDSIIVDKDGDEFPYMSSKNERNDDKLIEFDYIYNIVYKTLEDIINELNLHLKTEECKICESGGWFSIGMRYYYKNYYCDI